MQVLSVDNVASIAAQCEVHPGKYILGQVDRLRSFRDATLLDHDLLVHHVRMSVVHARSKKSVGSLQHSAEGSLSTSREVTERTDVTCDVLCEAHDPRLKTSHLAVTPAELPQRTGEQQHLLEISTLVGIDGLDDRPTCKDDRVVLIVSLPIPKYWEAWQLDLESWLPSFRILGLHGTALINQAAVVASLLLWMDTVQHGSFSFALVVNEGYLETPWEFPKQDLRMLVLHVLEERIHLHRNHAGEDLRWIPHRSHGRVFVPFLHHLMEALKSGEVVHETHNGSPKRL
mmetsp:Transcript_14164/g.33730  ORF Transcript_14164/g.33730 Transcript_14164/m.33730 type:complete len:287 (+) Transcript_14164:254-1114(+)